jgi:hypothetical protein
MLYPKYKSIDENVPLTMRIVNKYFGNERIIKKQIDDLGTLFYEQIAKKLGKENIKIERMQVSPPLFY